MQSAPRPLRVVVISQDESLLHETSWILEAVGYEVDTSSDFDPKALWRQYAAADVVILDGRNIAEPTAETVALDTDSPIYRLFLYDPTKPTEFIAWCAIGAHDALRTPLSRGELLARLRTGARYLEFERRLQQRSSRSSVPGMYSRRGFVRKLRKLMKSEPTGSKQYTVLATSIDWFDGISRKSGATAGCILVSAVARAIQRAVGESVVAAYLGDGRFVTLLTDQIVEAARRTAESIAKDFAGRESRLDSIPRPTLTSAVIPWTSQANPDQFLNEALETLHVAKNSGGDCVAVDGEFSKELVAWREEMSTGNPFSNVVAQDIMEPFPALVERDADQPELVAALERAKVAVRPYVDRGGRLAGIADDGGQLVTPETISHDASFPEIYEAFSSRGCSMLVVTGDQHPLGYLTCDGFLSMIDPIDTETYAGSSKPPDELRYLAVPAAIGEAMPADAV